MNLSLPSFIKLQSESRKKFNTQVSERRLAVVGNSSTQHIVTAIKGYANMSGLNLKVLDTPYNQMEGQFLDDSSQTFEFDPDYILIYICPEELYEKFIKEDDGDRELFAQTTADKIALYWTNIKTKSKSKIIQTLVMEKNDGVFGNYAALHETSFTFQIRKLNYILTDMIRKENGVCLLDTVAMQARYGMDFIFDNKMYYIGRLTLSLDFLPVFAKETIDIIKCLEGKAKKCLILDLDNTLWGGIVGDDGINGIQIGEIGSGRVYTDIQSFAKELKKRGIILAVCSKNEEKTAKDAFEKNPDMILKLEDFAVFVANWENKAENIRFIQETLNIGMDSIVFVDDNNFERNLVKQMIPEVTVPDLPDDPAHYLDFIRKLNLFEVISYSDEDKTRADKYRVEVIRKQAQSKYKNYEEYLEDLDMRVIVSKFDEFSVSRIAQLSQRSNQFNLRTIRYTKDDINKIMNNPQKAGIYFKLSDKYGDYGLVSVVVLDINQADLFIDTLLMSCRVLKRGLEEYVINTIIDFAKQNGKNTVIGEYLETKKNSMVKDLYGKMGFEQIKDGLWKISTAEYEYKQTKIKEMQNE